MKLQLLLAATFVSIVPFHRSHSQELQLFESLESSSRDKDAPSSAAIRRDSDGNIINGPEFTLIGTSKIGTSRTVVIKDTAGRILSVDFTPDRATNIPGHEGFKIISLGSGSARLKLPEGTSCVEYEEQGVICENSSTAILRLRNGAPLELRDNIAESSGNNSEQSNESQPLVNPFEALLERASGQDSDVDTTSSFEPRRIDPLDVPPGMRIVSTPFGDRLVELED